MPNKKENKTCPSYDSGFCETAPTIETKKCADLIKTCQWKNYNFSKNKNKKMKGE